MIRKFFINQNKKDKIKWRSHEVARIEALSDGVFAFAISLLVISLEVPKTSTALLESLWGLIPFAFSFGIIFALWRTQYKFFRRYGLRDKATLAMNGALLFFILAFVYPLKFFFSSLLMLPGYSISPNDVPFIVILYCSALVFIWLLFSMMYLNAYIQRREIQLTEIEVYETVNFLVNCAIPISPLIVISIVIFVERSKCTNLMEVLPYMCIGYIIPVSSLIFTRLRKKQYKIRFGNAPEVEPIHNPEG